ncbi:helix-turn-helix domain-containing protein [Belnapia sp. T6]|uniref:Helix-turn-helix domain-containing protein n=1 Tax=Belnapia mucosa TaxID=2804532 RepID=A0ABS1VAH0_9PROT|nr:helix-turn-helix domain-containing protein [Belnapia mucosa]
MAAYAGGRPVTPSYTARRPSIAARARRQGRFDEAARLHAAGASLSAISRQLGVDRKTLRRWLRAGAMPSWRQPQRGSVLDPYRDHLERRWAEGCHNAAPAMAGTEGTGRSGPRRHRPQLGNRPPQGGAGRISGTPDRQRQAMATALGPARGAATDGRTSDPVAARPGLRRAAARSRCPRWQPQPLPRSGLEASYERRVTSPWQTFSPSRRGRTSPTSSPSCKRISPLWRPRSACPGRPARPRDRSAASR